MIQDKKEKGRYYTYLIFLSCFYIETFDIFKCIPSTG